MLLRRVLTLAAVPLLSLVSGCASKQEVKLSMERIEETRAPEIRAIDVQPHGELDTTNRDRQVRVVMTGDPGLLATFDVQGPRPLSLQPMQEAAPGSYEGSFQVHRGENGRVNIVGRLADPASPARREEQAEGVLELFSEPTPPCDCPAGPAGIDCEALNRRLRELTILFEFDRAELNPPEQQLLSGLATGLALTACPLTIHGHADDLGTTDYNLSLSNERALAVRRYLEARGIDASRLRTQAHGSSYPAEKDTSNAARARNRRVEIRTAEN